MTKYFIDLDLPDFDETPDHLDLFYNREIRLWTLISKNRDGDQIADAEYYAAKPTASDFSEWQIDVPVHIYRNGRLVKYNPRSKVSHDA